MKSIFTVGVSWKVVQGRTKFTLLTFVRSEEDDPLGPTPLDTYLLYYLLRGLSSCFLLLGRIIIKEWDFKPSAKAQVLAPHNHLCECSDAFRDFILHLKSIQIIGFVLKYIKKSVHPFHKIIFFIGQNLSTVFMCYYLGSPLKILSCEFFLMEKKCIF